MSFNEIAGHERPRSILMRAVENQRLAHAYLFSGEKGIGKRMTAFALAAAVNCEQRGPDGGCGICPACRKAASLGHPDIHLIEADGAEIKIDQIRQAQADLALKPFEGAKKVLIVDEAENMNEASANAFLKTLEEPPGEVLIMLVSSLPQRLPLTIRSRCQEIRFHPLSRQALSQVIAKQRGLHDEDARFIAALARGSMGRALVLDAMEEKAGREELVRFWSNLPSLSDGEILSQAEAYGKDRERLERFFDVAVEWLRDVLVFRATGDENLLVHGQSRDLLRAWSERFSVQRMLNDVDILTQYRGLLQRRVSAQLVAENLFLKLARA